MLELDALTRRYGDVVALDRLDLTVPAGTMVGFVGTNGAGKTTAMRIAMGVLRADSGEVRWQGRPADAAARRAFGYMPEERGLYPKMTVLDQLVYLARLRGRSRDHARHTATDLLERLGLGARAGSRVEALSLGNQQRVQLAAALVHEPEALVLDEPFSGLDPVGVDTMAEVLHDRVTAGVAVVFSSHQLDLVERLCDAVGIVRDGRTVAAGTVDALRAGAAPRVRVGVDAPAGWTEQLIAAVPGSRLARGATAAGADVGTAGNPEHRTVLLELAPGSEPAVLPAAQRLGTVWHLEPDRPSLTELFRSVVAEDAPTEDAQTEDAR